MFDNLKADLHAAQEDRVLEKGILRVLLRMETIAIISYRFGHWVEKVKIPVVRQLLAIAAMILQRMVQVLVGIYISPDAEIGPGLTIHTPFGIIVGPNKIGSPTSGASSAWACGSGMTSATRATTSSAAATFPGGASVSRSSPRRRAR